MNEQWDWHNGEYPSGKADYPVVLLTWNEENQYCTWLGKKFGRQCRMPTVAEWEKAASWNFVKNEKYKYPWGNGAPQPDWYQGRQQAGGGSPVGSHPKDKSFCGCYDMFGNVMESCSGNSPGRSSYPPIMGLGYAKNGLSEVTGNGDASTWRGWHNGFRTVLIPTEKEKVVIAKILSSKGEFDVEEYLEKERRKRLANFYKEMFKGKVTKNGEELKFSYKFGKPGLISDFVFAADIAKPHKVTDDPGIWDEVGKSFSGGGKSIALTKAAFSGNSTFDIQLKLKNAKNLLFIIASINSPDASAACFSIGTRTDPLLDDTAEKCVEKGFTNLVLDLKKGVFRTNMISSSGKITVEQGKINCDGNIALTAAQTGSGSLDDIKATGNTSIGGNPIGPCAKKSLKTDKNYKFSIKVIDGFVFYYMGKDVLGFNRAPEGAYRIGVAAYNSLVNISKINIKGRVDQDWLKREIEK